MAVGTSTAKMSPKLKKATSPSKPVRVRRVKVKKVASSTTKSLPGREPRRLFKRNSDEAAERAIHLKLGMFPQKQLQTHKDELGKCIFENVKAEQYRVKLNKKHVTLGFWQGIIVQHNLTGSQADCLEEPKTSEKVNRQLDVCIRQAHHANPAQKCSSGLQRHMAHMAKPNATEYYGLCKACFESPSMSRPMSRILTEELLKLIGRLRCDLEYPHYWQILKLVFDKQLCEMWARAQSEEVTRAGWMRARRAELQMFIDMSLATKIEDEIEAGGEADPEGVEKLGKMSLIGSELFAPEALKLESSQFVSEAVQRLKELEDLGFDEAETEVFKRLMICSAEALDDEIWKQFDNRELKICAYGGVVKNHTANPNDEWAWRLDARARTLAVSSGRAPRTLYEEWLFGPSAPIPGCPQTIRPPDALIYDMLNGRDYINKRIGSAWQSIGQVRKTVKSHSDQWLKMDPGAWVDLYFLDHLYEKAIDTKLKQNMLDILPQKGERRSMEKAVVATRLLATGEIACAQVKPLMDSLNAAANSLIDVQEARAPTALELSKMEDFVQTFLKRAEWYCHVVAEQVDVEGKIVSKKTLFGHDALLWRYVKCQETMGVQDPQDLKCFRQFTWMLTDVQLAEFKKWEGLALVGAKERLQLNKAKALKDIEDETREDKDKKRKNSSSSAIVAAPAIKEKKVEKKVIEKVTEKEKEDEEGEDSFLSGDTGLVSFFGARAV